MPHFSVRFPQPALPTIMGRFSRFHTASVYSKVVQFRSIFLRVFTANTCANDGMSHTFQGKRIINWCKESSLEIIDRSSFFFPLLCPTREWQPSLDIRESFCGIFPHSRVHSLLPNVKLHPPISESLYRNCFNASPFLILGFRHASTLCTAMRIIQSCVGDERYSLLLWPPLPQLITLTIANSRHLPHDGLRFLFGNLVPPFYVKL